MKRVRIQVIKVYDVDVEECDGNEDREVLKFVESMQSTEIEKKGKLVSVETGHAEIIEDRNHADFDPDFDIGGDEPDGLTPDGQPYFRGRPTEEGE